VLQYNRDISIMVLEGRRVVRFRRGSFQGSSFFLFGHASEGYRVQPCWYLFKYSKYL
jgi:hypothetical protein